MDMYVFTFHGVFLFTNLKIHARYEDPTMKNYSIRLKSKNDTILSIIESVSI